MEPETTDLAVQGQRDPITHQFAEGNSLGGRTRGSKNLLARMVQAQIQADLEQHGAAGNPVVILLRFARDESLKPALRIQAAALASKFIAPKLLQVDVNVENVVHDDSQIRLAADPRYRAACELIVELMAADDERQRAIEVSFVRKALPAPAALAERVAS